MTSSLREHLQATLGPAYELDRELGGGGMSHVFLAHETALGRKVVVKVLLPELAAGVSIGRFRREIQVAAQLQHPHIVPLLSAGESNGLPYFTMPYVSGESLRARIAREGELPIADSVRILRDVVSALAYAHAAGVVHRDIKPDNVLLSGGVAVVTDFGVAKALTAASSDAERPSTSLTSIGVALGTPAYMAPEQAAADPATDHRADLYSLAVMAYEMLTGQPPFAGRPVQAVLAAHVVETPELVERRRPAVPPLLAALVTQCLAKRPADRPQTAAEVMHALDAIGTPSGGTASTAAVRVMPPSPARSTWRRAIVAVAAAGVAIVAGVVLTRRGTPPPAPAPAATTASAPAAPPPAPAAVTTRDSQSAQPLSRAADVTARRQRTAEERTSAARESRQDAPRPARPESRAVPETVVLVQPPVVPPPAPQPGPAAPPASGAPAAAAPSAPPPAAQPPATDPRAEIRSLIADYADAIESRNVGNVKSVYAGMTGAQQDGWVRFFETVRDVKARLDIAHLDVSGSSAEAQVVGTYTYLNTSDRQTEQQPVAFHASLRREPGGWRIIAIR